VNQQEALTICRLARAASPAQAVDEYTPDLWFEVLRGFPYADARQAVIELAGEQEWLHVSHVRTRIKRIRGARISEFGPLPEPPAECFEPEAYRRWKRETVRAIADGAMTERPALMAGVPKPSGVDFDAVFRSVDDELTTPVPAAALKPKEEA